MVGRGAGRKRSRCESGSISNTVARRSEMTHVVFLTAIRVALTAGFFVACVSTAAAAAAAPDLRLPRPPLPHGAPRPLAADTSLWAEAPSKKYLLAQSSSAPKKRNLNFRQGTTIHREGKPSYRETMAAVGGAAPQAPVVPFGGPALHRYHYFRRDRSSADQQEEEQSNDFLRPSSDSGTRQRQQQAKAAAANTRRRKKDGNEDEARGTDGETVAQNTIRSAGAGWIPSRYPNPRDDPMRCNIWDLAVVPSNEDGGGGGSIDVPSKFDNGGNHTSTGEQNSNEGPDSNVPHPATASPLLLCDPDYALGGYYLTSIAASLRNFSNSYGMESWCEKLQRQGTVDWTVGVGTATESDGIGRTSTSSTTAASGDVGAGAEFGRDARDRIAPMAWGGGRRRSLLRTTDVIYGTSERPRGRGRTLPERIQRSLRSTWVGGTTRSLYQWFRPDLFPNVASIAWLEGPRASPTSNDEVTRNLEFDPAAVGGKWLQVGAKERSSPATPAEMIDGPVEIGVAIAMKMNLPAVLRTDIYYSYEDEDDLINDAAQYFARFLHDEWWGDGNGKSTGGGSSGKSNAKEPAPQPECGAPFDDASKPTNPPSVSGILVFISVADRVCFISTGSAVSRVLPWWRLERVVANMKPSLRRGSYGDAILGAIRDVTTMLESGPPAFRERADDFVARFGVVLCFAIFTFLFAGWGEFRDRRRRRQYAESRSKLSRVETEEARKLQRDYHTVACPICLEEFDIVNPDKEDIDDAKRQNKTNGMRRVDSYGIPLSGTDGQPLKMLRCGHVFDMTCWQTWVNSGHGNPCRCPVCRQDVGGKKKRSRRSLREGDSGNLSANADGSGIDLLDDDLPLAAAQAHPSYDSIAQIHAAERWNDEDEGNTGQGRDNAGVGIRPATARALRAVSFWPLPFPGGGRRGSSGSDGNESTLEFDDDMVPPSETSALLVGEETPLISQSFSWRERPLFDEDDGDFDENYVGFEGHQNV